MLTFKFGNTNLNLESVSFTFKVGPIFSVGAQICNWTLSMEECNSLPPKLHMADTSISYIQDKQEQPKASSVKKGKKKLERPSICHKDTFPRCV